MAQTHGVVNDRITPQSEGVSPSAPRDLNLLASPWPALVLGVIATTAAALLINVGALENNPGWVSSLSGLGILAMCRGAWSLGRGSSQAASRSRLSVELAARSEAHFLTDNGGAVLFDNAPLRHMFEGLKRDAVLMLSSLAVFDDILDPGSKDAFQRLKSRAAVGAADVGEILVHSDISGLCCWKVALRPVDAETGLTLWTLEDISTQYAHEKVRAGRDAYIADLLDFLPCGFFSADDDGNLRYYNETLRGWLDLEPVSSGAAKGASVAFAEFVEPGPEGDQVETDASGMHGRIMLCPREGESFAAYLIQSEETGADGQSYSRSLVLREPFMPVLDDGTGWPILRRIPWLFADAPVGIVFLDLQGDVADCNRAFLKLLGLHRDGVVGRPLYDRISKEDRDDASAQLSKVVMGTLPATLMEARMPAGGERELTVSLHVSPIHDAEGEVTGMALFVIDTTEQKNLEIQFNQAQKMQAVGQLAGGVAHDFNNLLTAMMGFCDLLLARHGEDDPSFADIMQIKQNANRAANLVRQLLAFSRRQTLQPKIFSINDALDDLSHLLHRLIGENIELTIEHGEAVDLIRTDPGQFDQVIINLAVNARDAMPGGGGINVTTERVTVDTAVQRGHEVMPAGAYILIKVADSGSGIAKEDLGRIFEPFFSTKDVGEGTGLGLSTVYGIIRQSDGYVFVDSALGEGTTFSIYLPAFSAEEATAFGAEVASIGLVIPDDHSDLTGEATVLLVEDEDAVRVFGSRALRNKGYRVLEAGDGEEALDVINGFDQTIDLIITDVMMPGMDGHTLVSLVREEIPGIKIILMSGYAEDAIPGGISADSALNFLPKPFSLADLAGKVKEVIAS
jgi:two-component system cell cycle sensor histidine kinase/response regulator CckA